MLNLAMLKWRPFKYKAESAKEPFLSRSEIDIFDKFFKGIYKKSFEDLQ